MSEQLLADQSVVGNLILDYQKVMLKTPKEKSTVGWFKTQLEGLEKLWSEFYQQHKVISRDKASLDDHPYFVNDDYATVYTQFNLTKTLLLNSLHPGRSQTTLEADAYHADVALEGPIYKTPLPPINLPQFSGRQLEWETFKGMFVALVHDVPNIPPILKMQYLLRSLTGEAAKRVKNIPVTPDNYAGAWQTLVDKYDNKKVLLSTHMSNIITCNPVTKRSLEELTRITDTLRESKQAFTNLHIPPAAMGDYWLVHHTVHKLDAATRLDWEKEVDTLEEFPTYTDLLTFLERTTRVLCAARPTTSQLSSAPATGQTKKSSKPALCNTATKAEEKQGKSSKSCARCQGLHFLAYCEQYKVLDVQGRLEFVKSHHLCTNCLKRKHKVDECRAAGRCLLCHERHHSSLHGASELSAIGDHTSETAQTNATVECAITVNSSKTALQAPVLLATAVVILQNRDGKTLKVRALLDQGAELSFVTSRVQRELALPLTRIDVPVFGIGGATPGNAQALVSLTLRSPVDTDFQAPMEALVLNKLTSLLPWTKVDPQNWTHLKGLHLADPAFASPGNIDCIIGSELYGSLLLGGLIRGGQDQPIAQQTVLGWILSGRTTPRPAKGESPPVRANLVATHTALDDLLPNLWRIEEASVKPAYTPQEEACEHLFRQSTSYDSQARRFTVDLPLMSDPLDLGDSRSTAVACWLRQESKFKRDPDFGRLYQDFMREYRDLGHMTLCINDPPPRRSYYIPHHGIVKRNGASTKIRVVFNASKASANGKSLNEQLYAGPKLQTPLWLVLTRWRFHRIAMMADITKMFRQIQVCRSHTDYQLVIWRENPELPLQTYRLLTVTYGTTPAPYLAIRVLLELASLFQEKHPMASRIINKNRYVDDFLFGANTDDETDRIRQDLEQLLNKAGMSLSKWAANSPGLLDEECLNKPVRLDDEDPSVSALGLLWLPAQDLLSIHVHPIKLPATVTKRVVVSLVARLFDPLGWLGPVVIRAKVLIQDLWVAKVQWDAPLPTHLEQPWRKFVSDITTLQQIQVPRFINSPHDSNAELHGFCDARERAYAACVYLVVRGSDQPTSHLVLAKTKVAPVKTLSMPRLELCGAHLLARLLHDITTALQDDYTFTVHCWTDAQIVLHWLREHPSRWTTFVATRVSTIQDLLPSASWQHITSADNPADIATRGSSVVNLQGSQLWWHGPPYYS